ncbi:MAG TPA: hypothetical protein DD671_08870, partial [Balneolaceae bacterium]|nr:hypothetical protein [Balneolaceae bacterium]
MSEFAKEIPIIGNALSKVFAVEENMKKFASFLGRMGAALGDIPVLGTALAKSGRIVARGIGFMASAAGVAVVSIGILGAAI